ncbi:MAG: type III-B CRISPR module RAMP protein Cmr1 [Anaerolineae bacterium]
MSEQKLHEIRVTLETVTPLFLGGADPRGAPELRPPSLRGALRYWLRAALGGVLGDQNLDALRKAEAAVFGSAGESSASVSPVAVRLAHRPPLKALPYSKIEKETDKSFGWPGIAYLFFAARKTRTEQERSALMGKFSLQLQLLPGADPSALSKACLALWLFTRLGGLGNRSRRGAGSLQVTDIQGELDLLEALPSLVTRADSPQKLVKELESGLNILPRLLGADSRSFCPNVPGAFDVIHPAACRIFVLNRAYKGWQQALDEFGKVYQAFRNRRPPDYQVIKDEVTSPKGQLSKPVERAAFGLPIPFFYRSLGNRKATLAAEKHDRRASPLWIRVTGLANGTFTIVLTWFRSQFLPPGEDLLLSHGRDQKSRGEVPDDQLIGTFLTSLPEKGLSLLEVSYA